MAIWHRAEKPRCCSIAGFVFQPWLALTVTTCAVYTPTPATAHGTQASAVQPHTSSHTLDRRGFPHWSCGLDTSSRRPSPLLSWATAPRAAAAAKLLLHKSSFIPLLFSCFANGLRVCDGLLKRSLPKHYFWTDLQDPFRICNASQPYPIILFFKKGYIVVSRHLWNIKVVLLGQENNTDMLCFKSVTRPHIWRGSARFFGFYQSSLKTMSRM